MKVSFNKWYIIGLLLIAGFFSSLRAQDNPCAVYEEMGVYMTVSINRTILSYDISRNGTIDPPYVDSVWITDSVESVIQVYHDVQSGDPLDIAFLPRGHYLLFIQVGNCVMGRMFIARGTYPTDIDDILELHSQTISKFIRNGQLFIRRGEKVYSIDGQQVK